MIWISIIPYNHVKKNDIINNIKSISKYDEHFTSYNKHLNIFRNSNSSFFSFSTNFFEKKIFLQESIGYIPSRKSNFIGIQNIYTNNNIILFNLPKLAIIIDNVNNNFIIDPILLEEEELNNFIKQFVSSYKRITNRFMITNYSFTFIDNILAYIYDIVPISYDIKRKDLSLSVVELFNKIVNGEIKAKNTEENFKILNTEYWLDKYNIKKKKRIYYIYNIED